MSMETEIEILDIDISRFLYSKLVEVKEMEVPIQRIVVNGVETVVNGKGYALVCPCCGQKVLDLPQGISYVDAIKSLVAENEEDVNKNIYCQSCGQKLQLLRAPTIIQ